MIVLGLSQASQYHMKRRADYLQGSVPDRYFQVPACSAPVCPDMEGVNHCRLVKFRGLMIRVKYGAVIGLKNPEPRNCNWAHTKKTFLGQSQRRI